MKGNGIRLLAMLLAVLLCISLIPMQIFAEDPAGGDDPGRAIPLEPVLTVEFYADGVLFDIQNVRDGESIHQPDTAAVTPAGQKLKGFYLDGAEFTDFEVPQTVTAAETRTITAQFEEIGFYVIYHTDGGSVIRRDKLEAGYTFHADNPAFPIAEGYVNEFWKAEDGTEYHSGDTPALDADIHVYPSLKGGSYVRFNSNGGTHVDSQFVLPGQTATEPAAPTRSGYTFGSWQLSGSDYDFSAPVTGGITLTANWIPAAAPYTVRIWLQNANDDDYTFGTSFTKTGTTGGAVSFDNADKTNSAVTALTYTSELPAGRNFPIFFLKGEPDDEKSGLYKTNADIARVASEGGIAGDGSTVLNVYYDRLVFMAEFNAELGGYGIFTYEIRNGETLDNAATRQHLYDNPNFARLVTEVLGDSPTTNYNYLIGKSKNDQSYAPRGNHSIHYYANAARYAIKNGNNGLNDECKIVITMISNINGTHKYTRIEHLETVESALTNPQSKLPIPARKDYNEIKSDLKRNYTENPDVFYISPANTNGYMLGSPEGFSDYFHVVYNRLTDIVVGPSKFTGIIGTEYEDPGYLEYYCTRNFYTIEFSTGASGYTVNPLSLPYEQPLKDRATEVVDQNGNPLVIGQTKYQDGDTVYVFQGWYDNPALAGQPYIMETTEQIMPAHNLSLYAKWEKQPVTLSFDPAVGTLTDAPSKVYGSGNIPSAPTPPTAPEGMTFIGWTLNGTLYDFSDPIYTDTKLVALYMPESDVFTVTYDYGEGTGAELKDNSGYLYGASAKVLAPGADLVPPAGKFFNYWEIAPAARSLRSAGPVRKYYPGDLLDITGHVTLIARYGAKQLTTLTYDPGTGSGDTLTDLAGSITGAMAPVYGGLTIGNVEINSKARLSSGAGFAKEHHYLIGWNSDRQKAADGIVEFGCGEIVLLNDPAGQTLYAVWAPLATLTVEKTVGGNAGSTTKLFDFKVTLDNPTITGIYGEMTFAGGVAEFKLSHGQSKTAEDLPVGMGYTVTEADYSADGYTTTKTGDTGTTDGSAPQRAVFTNTRNAYSSLQVRKLVEGDAASTTDDFSFKVELSDTTITGTYGDMEFANGVAEFKLSHAQSKTAKDLPVGVRFTVTESDYSSSGYTTTKTGDTGIIEEGVVKTAVFTNTRNGGIGGGDDPTDSTEPAAGNETGGRTGLPHTGPKTGDESNLGLWLGVVLAGTAVLLLTLLFGKRKPYSGKYTR